MCDSAYEITNANSLKALRISTKTQLIYRMISINLQQYAIVIFNNYNNKQLTYTVANTMYIVLMIIFYFAKYDNFSSVMTIIVTYSPVKCQFGTRPISNLSYT